MRKKTMLAVLLSLTVSVFVVGGISFAADVNKNNDHMMNSETMSSMMNGNSMSTMMKMMEDPSMSKMMNAMNSSEGQEMMKSCSKFMESYRDKNERK